MPNYCFYEMRVKGDKENCEELLSILKGEHKRYFYRVMRDEVVFREWEAGEMWISGFCAWSVDGTFCSKEQYCDYDFPSTTLLEESILLNLDIEIYSDEAGIGFAEHYHFLSGEVLADELVDYEEYYWDTDEYPTLEEFNAAHNTHFTMKDFEEMDCYAVIGGFPNKWVD